ncbi:hypothetical protein KUTeg_014567 [Tegillarca granosa]|uniref:Beta-lactamase-related domain-containing protein n=1 Tax=Tegillarca granosa TaxID=220873 RepID=A0ABQ9ERM8_TEGGR|nr:hypothetical protein KUTeg_014567 [Tegillarca granosa]
MWNLLLTTISFLSIIGLSLTEEFNFDKAFQAFLRSNNYNGAQVGVMVEGRLAFAKGYGKNRENHLIHNESSVPISALSKALTVVAAIKLVEDGKLELGSKVFGHRGVLQMLKPWDTDTVDERIYDITVDHLLRHTGGWDSQHSKMFDPVLNEVLLAKGFNVKNITKLMNLTNGPTPYDIIRFMMSERLEFTPGMRSVVSNLGYIILGKIIEIKSDLPYQEYVKKHVLNPCGMLHTRIRKPHINQEGKPNEPVYDGHGKVNPLFVDSALGWESNVYDMLRFAQCLDGSADYKILNDESLRLLMAKPSNVQVEHGESWMAGGFHTNNQGALWMEGEEYTDELLFYHKGPLRTNGHHTRGLATAWVILLDGHTFTPIKHIINVMVSAESNWPTKNHFLDDVADIQVSHDGHNRIVKAKLNEHHIDAYFRALVQLRYDLKWINGYTHKKNTYFAIIAEKVNHSLLDKVVIEHGLTNNRLLLQKQQLQDRGYNLTFLQNYYSFSHDGRKLFLALFRSHAYNNHTKIKYGMQHYSQSYKKLLELYTEEGYIPTSESLEYNGNDGLVSFILQRTDDNDPNKKREFREYEGMSLSRLEKTIRSNARYQRKLIYLDSSDYFGKPRFSSVFVKDSSKQWLFNGDLDQDGLKILVERELDRGLLPKILVGFTDKDGALKFALDME